MTILQRIAAAAQPLDLAQIAREEFAVVAKAYFAPIYGLALVAIELSKRTGDQ